MKNIVLLKAVDHIQVGHLYEHIYCDFLSQAFRKKGLFSYVDYSLDAKTYHKGFIRLELSLWNKAAVLAYQSIQEKHPEIGDDGMDGGLLQIMAEKYADVQAIDRTQVLAMLQHYDQLPWCELDRLELDVIPRKRERKGALELVPRSARHFLQLHQDISFNLEKSGLDHTIALALSAVVAKAIRETLAEDIAAHSFCYSVSDEVHLRLNQLIEKNMYRIDRRQASVLTNEAAIASDLISSVRKNGFSERLSAYLRNDDNSTYWQPPNDQEIYTKTGVLVGPDGWRKIASVKNVNTLLDVMTISFRIGLDRQTVDA